MPADRPKGFEGEAIRGFKTHDISAQQTLILGDAVWEAQLKKELKRWKETLLEIMPVDLLFSKNDVFLRNINYLFLHKLLINTTLFIEQKIAIQA